MGDLLQQLFDEFRDSGRLWLEADSICYASQSYGSWRMPLAEVRLIGESTNQDGPFAADYFFCFARDATGWVEASFHADGRQEFLDGMRDRLGTELDLQLWATPDYASRILWPADLAGRPMFDFCQDVSAGRCRQPASRLAPHFLKSLSESAERVLSLPE